MAEFTLKDLRDMIPEYDGDQSNLHDFIEAVNFAIANSPNNNQNALIFIIKSRLKGKARQFISSRQLNAWGDIKDLLITHYGDCRDTEGLLRDLTNCSQKYSETPRSFVQRIENLLTKIRATVALNEDLNNDTRRALNASHEKIALKTFLAGLNDPFGGIIRSQRPQSLEEAEQFLIEEENISYLKGFKISGSSKNVLSTNKKIVPKENYQTHSTHPDEKFCNYCKKKGHLINSCYKRNRFSVNNQNSPSNSHFINRTQNFENNSARNSNTNQLVRMRPGQHNQLNHLNCQGGLETGNLIPTAEDPILNLKDSYNINSNLVYITSKNNERYLIDSGAAISIIKNKIVPPDLIRNKENITIKDILSKTVHIGESCFKQFNSSSIQFKMYIADLDIDSDAILGLDFLFTFKCVLDFHNNVLRTNFKDIPLHYDG